MAISEKYRSHKHYLISAAILILFMAPGFLVPCIALCDQGVTMKRDFTWPVDIDGWKVSEGPDAYNRETAFKYMDGAAELFLAYNMRALTVVRYEKPGRPAITTEIFQMGSGEDAYGLFSFESDDPGAGIGQGSEFGGGLLRFWKGHLFASIYGENSGEDVEAATLRIGQFIAGSIEDTGKPAKILSYLPNGEAPFAKSRSWFLHSHILLNQRFFIANRNVLNLANDVDVAMAQYGTGKDTVHLLLAGYPSENRGDQAFSNFRSARLADAADKLSVRTQNNRWTAAQKYGTFIVIVFDAPDEAFASKLIRAASTAFRKEGR